MLTSRQRYRVPNHCSQCAEGSCPPLLNPIFLFSLFFFLLRPLGLELIYPLKLPVFSLYTLKCGTSCLSEALAALTHSLALIISLEPGLFTMWTVLEVTALRGKRLA